MQMRLNPPEDYEQYLISSGENQSVRAAIRRHCALKSDPSSIISSDGVTASSKQVVWLLIIKPHVIFTLCLSSVLNHSDVSSLKLSKLFPGLVKIFLLDKTSGKTKNNPVK